MDLKKKFIKSLVVFVALLMIFLVSIYSGNENENMNEKFTISSPVFDHMGNIPSKYTCDGENISPPLTISNVPEGTKSLVLLMDDPDIPDFAKENIKKDSWDHWVLYNIPADTTEISEGSFVGTQGLNSRSNESYGGPCPPDKEHRYFFKLYALDGSLNFIKAPTLDEVKTAIEDMIIEETELIGLYERVREN